jgi:hypothetical protein
MEVVQSKYVGMNVIKLRFQGFRIGDVELGFLGHDGM